MDSKDTLFISGATGQLGAFILAELLGYLSSEKFSGPIICARRASSTMAQIHMVEDFLGLEKGAVSTHPNVIWIDCDLSDAHHVLSAIDNACAAHEISRPVSFIHGAATINISPTAANETLNEKLTEEMLILAEMIGAEHFTHISSVAVMGGSAPLGEVETLGPKDFHPNRSEAFLSNYALGKIASELRVWAAQASGLSISIIRPGVILGIGPKRNAPQELWRRLKEGKMPFSTDGSTGVVDVRDVATVIVKAHTGRLEGPYIAVAENLEFAALISKMNQSLGMPPATRELKADPWLDRMRFFGVLKGLPFIGKFFTPQIRIMLFSKTRYDGSSGAELVNYRSLDRSVAEFGGYLSKVWE